MINSTNDVETLKKTAGIFTGVTIMNSGAFANIANYAAKNSAAQPNFGALIPGLGSNIQEMIGAEAEEVKKRSRYDIMRDKNKFIKLKRMVKKHHFDSTKR